MNTYHVLIVEDHWDVRRVLRSGLESLEQEITIVDVPSGEEALLVSTHLPIDLLVADIRLAGMTGLELQRIVRHRNPDAKIILFTGLTDTKIREEMSDSGADALFFKPVDMADFLETVERCLGLVEGIIPEVPILEIDELEDEPEISLSETLSDLRQRISAKSVILMDDNGQILAQAGDLPDVVRKSSLMSSLMAVFSASEKVSNDLGMKSPQDFMCFSGMNYDVYQAHIGSSFALLVVIDSQDRDKTDEAMVGILRPAVDNLLDVLSNIGLPIQPFVENRPTPHEIEKEVGKEGEASELDVVFQQASEIEFNPQEINDFWETAIGQSSGETKPDTGELSYDQAHQLGLTPDDDA